MPLPPTWLEIEDGKLLLTGAAPIMSSGLDTNGLNAKISEVRGMHFGGDMRRKLVRGRRTNPTFSEKWVGDGRLGSEPAARVPSP